MSDVPLFRCVCGTDIPLEDGKLQSCPRCGRQHGQLVDDDSAASETVFVSRSGHRLSPVKKNRAVGGDESGADERLDLAGKTLDHFEIIEKIGQGGMGTVYRALDRSLERYVAIKVITREDVLKDGDMVEAFVHEARSQARVNHPGVTTIHYVGQLDAMPYFAMELVPGVDLETRLEEGPLPFAEVVNVGIEVLRALREANERGVVHRDIKPGNILLTRSGNVKITDFGLSKTDKGGLQVTGARGFIGSPYYIAPEQARGETTDFRTDIYSLGATLYHLAYGRPPFEGDGFMGVIAKHLSVELAFPKSPPKGVSPAFQSILRRMLAKDPAARHASYDKLERELLAVRPEEQRVASFFRRAGAAFMDWGALMLALAVMMGVVMAILVATNSAWISTGSPDMEQPNLKVEEAEKLAPIFFMINLGFLVALCLQQAIFRRTVGKIFGRLRIASIDGQPVARWRLLFRTLFQFSYFAGPLLLSAAGLEGRSWHTLLFLGLYFLDGLWALTNAKRRTLHDILLGTWVLRES